MNRFVQVLLIAVSLASSSPVFAQGQLSSRSETKIRWMESVPTALKQRRETGRPLVIYVTADYCGYCRKMERESWSDEEVVKAVVDDFVALKIDADKDEKLVERLEVRGYPTTLVFDEDGRLVKTAEGFQSRAQLLKLLERKKTAAVSDK